MMGYDSASFLFDIYLVDRCIRELRICSITALRNFSIHDPNPRYLLHSYYSLGMRWDLLVEVSKFGNESRC